MTDDLTGPLVVNVRTFTGIWTLTRVNQRWRGSCGVADGSCVHLAAALDWLDDVATNRREGYGDE
jgi:hypothetical protein